MTFCLRIGASAAASSPFLVPMDCRPDTFHGSAWLGVVPFWMDRIKLRGFPPIPGTSSFPELNLRTYVRDQRSGTPRSASTCRWMRTACWRWRRAHHVQNALQLGGDATAAAHGARVLVLQPQDVGERPEVIFKARYRGLGPTRKLVGDPQRDRWSISSRSAIACSRAEPRGEPMRANMHHVPWPLEEAEAEIEQKRSAAAAVGIQLPE